MSIFAVKIKETRERIVYVDCDYDFEAESKAENIYDRRNDLLDKDYVVDVQYELLKEDN